MLRPWSLDLLVQCTQQEDALSILINFCKQVNMKVLGLIENMGPFPCPHCGKEIALFKKGGGRATADAMSVPFLGSIPFDPAMVIACDDGTPIMGKEEHTPISEAYNEIVENIKEGL